jgi:uncharacterized protein (DUF1697 family)
MSHAVFLRAMNVGGKNVFKPAQLATALAHLGMVNVGAAGTFVIRERLTAAAVRREILARMSGEPELAIVPAKEILDLVRSDPFRGVKFSKDVRGWAAVLCAKPNSKPALPMVLPAGKPWSVRFERVQGSFALGQYRRVGGSLFPNQVVEKALGVRATTRWWETIVKLADLIER